VTVPGNCPAEKLTHTRRITPEAHAATGGRLCPEVTLGYQRDLETRGRARATVTRRLCTIAGSYKYAVEGELLDHLTAAHVRRPRIDYESHATALDRNELGALLVAAGLGPPAEHALVSLLALNGLRVSEATGAGG
jgi:site-specific recombinase XerD